VPRSRRQRTSPQRKPEALAYEVVQLRKHLAKQGLDAGAVTIAYDLAQRHGRASARSTTWRILSRRASSPCSHKRPKGSYVRFEAAMPNKRWHVRLVQAVLSASMQGKTSTARSFNDALGLNATVPSSLRCLSSNATVPSGLQRGE
jgi:hypothetical protein